MKRALIIFIRQPVPGQVKTRLAATVGNDAAAELYAAMVHDILAMATELDSVTPLLFWADNTIPPLPLSGTAGFRSYLQGGENLGERMVHALSVAYAAGYDSCCIIGSDAPDLPADYIKQAFHLLDAEKRRVVFGPATDGGYYLVGSRQPWPGLFDNVPWSNAHTLEKNLGQAAALGLTTALLPEWHDIDTFDDLQSFCRKNSAQQLKTFSVAQHYCHTME